MSNKITFKAVHSYAYELAERPYPASENIPKWFKSMPQYIENEAYNPTGSRLLLSDLKSNLSPKRCMPMKDAMSSGYIIPLWADVVVVNMSRDGETYMPYVSWKTTKEVFETNIDGEHYLEYPEGYAETIFKFLNVWCIKTPPGYSTMITPPAGHNGPLRSLTAVVDTDKYDAALPIPMFIQRGFEGIIKKGTPLVQVTPFKRENWKAEYDLYKDGEFAMKQEKWLRLNAFGNYIKTQWSKKTYE